MEVLYMLNTSTSVGHTKEELENTLNRINFWIGNCDTKISFSMAFGGILLGGFFSSSIITGSLNKLIKKLSNIDSIKHYWEIRLVESTSLVLIAFLLCMAITIYYLFKALKGSINNSIYEQPGITIDSKIFFDSIANQPFQTFKQKVTAESASDILNDYLSQVYINSKICRKKFNLYNTGIKYLLTSFILFVILNVLFVLF
jgi:hypothetical protein